MSFLAVVGRGCDHCENGKPIERIKSRAGLVELCLECVLLWFPGRKVAWWEERHAPYADHLGDALEAAREKAFQAAVHEHLTQCKLESVRLVEEADSKPVGPKTPRGFDSLTLRQTARR